MKPSIYRPFPTTFRHLFDDAFPKAMTAWLGNEDFFTTPAVNVRETEKSWLLDVAAPGLAKDDFKLDLENGLLTISAEQRQSAEDQTDNYTRREFHFASFKRSFQLPEGVKEDQIKANYADGILTIDLPKDDAKATPNGRTIEIQ